MMNAMDIWQMFCYLNVFFVLVEYCFVLWLSQGVSLENVIRIKESKKIEIVIILISYPIVFKYILSDGIKYFSGQN